MTKGFWLPIELLHDKNTTMQEKLLLIEINQLSMLDKGCIASNNHFAETFKVKKESISRSLSSLEKKWYISSKIKDGSRNHSRTITINKMLFEYEQNVISPLTNCLETKENKTVNTKPSFKSTNEKLYNDYMESKEVSVNEAKIILDYLVYRKDIGKQIKTLNPLNSYYKVVLELHKKGYDIKACIDLMKEKEWQTLKEEWVVKNGITNKPDFTEVVM